MKVGTIGSGMIVDLFIDSAKTVEGVSVDFVYSRTMDRAKEFADKHHIDHYCDSIDDLVNSDLIDTVYIASPNALHYHQAYQSLMAKKNVILEKPVTATVKEYKELMQVAKENGVYIVEAITNAHCASMKYLANHLHKIGNVKCVTANFSQYSSRYDKYKEGIVTNVFDLKMEGGALVDIGIYNLYVCMHLFKKPVDMHYFANIGFNGIDTSGALILQYPSFFASLVAAKDCFAPNTFTIQGDEGTMIIDEGSAGRCHHVSLWHKGNMVDEFRQSDVHMGYEINDFKCAFETKDEASIDAWNQESLDVLEIMESARRKAGIHFCKEK